MALTTVSSDRLATNVKNTNFTAAEKQDLTDDIKPLLGSSGGGNKNLIINGAMQVSQRGTSFTPGNTTSDAVYTLDRMQASNNHDGALTITQDSTSPDGFANSLKVDITTADTSLAAGQYAQILYKVEAQDLQQLAFGTSAAKSCILSFYVRSNKTGNYGVAVLQNDNSNKQVTFQYTINSADTWERKTFLIPGDTAGVINDDTGRGFDIHFGLASGTQYTSGSLRSSFTAYADADLYAGQGVNLLDSTSNEWYITGIQLEVGTVVTEFDHKSFAQVLKECERYCEATKPRTLLVTRFYGSQGAPFNYFMFRTQKRATPTISTTGTTFDTTTGFGAPTFASINENGSRVYINVTRGANGAMYIDYQSGNPIIIEAEL